MRRLRANSLAAARCDRLPPGGGRNRKSLPVFVTLPFFVRIGVAEGAKGLRDRQTGEVKNADTSNGSERRPCRDRERKSPARSGGLVRRGGPHSPHRRGVALKPDGRPICGAAQGRDRGPFHQSASA